MEKSGRRKRGKVVGGSVIIRTDENRVGGHFEGTKKRGFEKEKEKIHQVLRDTLE